MNLYTDASGTLMPLVHYDGKFTGLVGGYKHAGPSTIARKTLCGKSFLPLQLQSTAGAIIGGERRCFSTATTSLSVIPGAGVPLDHQKSWP